jgi:hypothetical protein
VTNSLTTFGGNRDPNRSASLESAASTAIANRDKARAALATASPSHPALTDFADAEKEQGTWFAAAKGRVKPLAEMTAAKQAKDATKATRDAQMAGPTRPGRSKRLQAFVDLVNKEKIQPLTEYARENWPAHPDEFYAEAYSLFLSDPTYLKGVAPKLFDFFDTGKHRV